MITAEVAKGLAPPAHAFRASGLVMLAEFREPWFIRQKRYTGRRAEGVRYEKKVQEYLRERYGFRYVPSPWLRFFAEGAWRWCQPDGLLFNFEKGIITLVEVKYSHTSDAWWQLKQLYGPVLRWLFPRKLWRFQYIEICKWYDPAVKFPEDVRMTPEIELDTNQFKVHIWRA